MAGAPAGLSGLLALASIGPETLRAAAGGPGFLLAVLEYVCADEALLRDVAAGAGHSPESLDRARQVLQGPQPDWGA